jgi:hypothetical protein
MARKLVKDDYIIRTNKLATDPNFLAYVAGYLTEWAVNVLVHKDNPDSTQEQRDEADLYYPLCIQIIGEKRKYRIGQCANLLSAWEQYYAGTSGIDYEFIEATETDPEQHNFSNFDQGGALQYTVNNYILPVMKFS